MYTTYIENVDEEIEIEIEFDYQPYEPMTRHYPGCNEDIEFCGFTVVDTGAEIEIIDENLLDDLKVEILEWIKEESEMQKYGYLLDY